MLVERGAERVVSFDKAPKPKDAWERPEIVYIQGDICDRAAVFSAIEGADCVWHIAAAVGPYHPKALYERVNHQGTVNVIDACKHHHCTKMIYSSSPSTRFNGDDVDGLTELQMPSIPMTRYLQEYARTKALGEIEMREALDDNFFACAIAPHQVYGPRDNLFLPNLLEAAGTGRMRVMGDGRNRICFTHVDNYCHGLIIGEQKLYKGSPVLGQFYIITDADTHPNPQGYALFYDVFDEAVQGMGFPSIKAKWSIPTWLITFIAYICVLIELLCCGLVRLKLNPFAVKMMTMHRWFNVSRSEQELGYKPIIPFRKGWDETIVWFRENWLPGFLNANKGLLGLYANTQRKIDIAAGKRTD